MARTRGTTIENTAESIGAALGKVAARFDAWSQQRTEIASELHRVMGAAQSMLGELKVGPIALPTFLTGNTGSGKPRGRKPGFKMSAATRAKLRAAWARRKAAGSSGESASASMKRAAPPSKSSSKATGRTGQKRTISPEGRERIAAAQRARWAKQRKG